MKRITAVLFTFACCLTAEAKTVTFYNPTEIYDLVRVSTERVNLREGPSAKMPRLVEVPWEGEECAPPRLIWSNEVKGKSQPVYADGNGALATYIQLGRNHDWGKYDEMPAGEELWINFAFIRDENQFPVWVKREFCEIMPLNPISPDDLFLHDSPKPNLVIRQGGVYDGWCFYDNEMLYEGDTEGLYVGKLIDGKVLLPLRYTGYFNCTENSQSIEVCNGHINYSPAFEVSTLSPYGCESSMLDFSKLTDSDISKILEQCEPTTNDITSYEIVLLKNTFDGGYIRLDMSTHENNFFGLPIEKITEEIPECRQASTASRASASQAQQALADIFETTEEAPSFPGGPAALYKWIGEHMQYPGVAQQRRTMGRVLVKFTVLADGSIGAVDVTKSVSPELDAEAVRLVRTMPRWNPGTVGGRPVNSSFVLPINFKLN